MDRQVRMVCDKRELADRLVTGEGFGIRAIFLPGILESGNDKSEVPLHEPFHKRASFHVSSQPMQVSLQVVFNERSKIGAGNEIDIQHHHKLGSSIQPSQVSPSVELSRSFRHLEWGENEMDVDVG